MEYPMKVVCNTAVIKLGDNKGRESPRPFKLFLRLVEFPALGTLNDDAAEFITDHTLNQQISTVAAQEVNVTAADG